MSSDEASSASDGQFFRRVLGNLPTGVAVVAALGDDEGPVGMTVGSFTSVSLSPPLVAFLADRGSTTFPLIRDAGRFCASVLSADQATICRQLAAKGGDKFASVAWHAAPNTGSPCIDGCLAWVDCEITEIHPAGDHFIVLASVRALDAQDEGNPLVFFRGGYGRFWGLSLTAWQGSGLFDLMWEADVVRPLMDELASEADLECIAIAREGENLFILANSGTLTGRGTPTRVGLTYPMIPPMGAIQVAWESEEVVNDWFERRPRGDRRPYEEIIDRVRSRGWSVCLMSDAQRAFDAAVNDLAAESTPETIAAVQELGGQVSLADFEPQEIQPGESYQVRSVAAPVYEGTGRVAFSIGVYGDRLLDGREVSELRDRVTRTAEAASRAIQVTRPA